MEHFGTNRGSRNRKEPRKSRAWFFTLDHGNEDMVEQLIRTFERDKVLEYVFQLEKGEGGMVHFQGVVRYANPRANWPPIKAHWEKCKNWKSAIRYCCKRETRVAGPWTNIKGLKWKKKLQPAIPGELYDWQKKLEEIFLTEPNIRDIYWIYDKKGCGGKTSFGKYMFRKYKGNVVILGNSVSNGLRLLSTYINELDFEVKLVIIDLARKQRNNVNYTLIETCKSGFALSGKYEPVIIDENPMHVFIFSNYMPEKDDLSSDRWTILEI